MKKVMTIFELTGMPDDVKKQNKIVTDSIRQTDIVHYHDTDADKYYVMMTREFEAVGCDTVRKLDPSNDVDNSIMVEIVNVVENELDK